MKPSLKPKSQASQPACTKVSRLTQQRVDWTLEELQWREQFNGGFCDKFELLAFSVKESFAKISKGRCSVRNKQAGKVIKELMLTKMQYFHFEIGIVMPASGVCGLINNTVTTMGYLHLLIGLI